MPPLLPPVINPAGIVEHVRKRGSLAYPLEALPHDFANWRLQLRRHARAAGMRISVIRGSDHVFVLDPDHEPTPETLRAVVEAIASAVIDDPAEQIDYDQALEKQRRQRLRIVPDEAD
jgi:uncharacterized protein with von Willebrand factor type A (vWA) domain